MDGAPGRGGLGQKRRRRFPGGNDKPKGMTSKKGNGVIAGVPGRDGLLHRHLWRVRTRMPSSRETVTRQGSKTSRRTVAFSWMSTCARGLPASPS